MANGKIQPFTSLDQSKHHCYTLSTTCTLFKLASEVGPRTIPWSSLGTLVMFWLHIHKRYLYSISLPKAYGLL